MTLRVVQQPEQQPSKRYDNAAPGQPGRGCRDLAEPEAETVAEARIAERPCPAHRKHCLDDRQNHSWRMLRVVCAASGGAGAQRPFSLRSRGRPQPSQSARSPDAVRATDTVDGRCEPKMQVQAIPESYRRPARLKSDRVPPREESSMPVAASLHWRLAKAVRCGRQRLKMSMKLIVTLKRAWATSCERLTAS